MKKLHALISALVVGCFAAVAIPAAKAVPINGTITFSPPDPNTFGSVTTVAGTTTVAFPTPMLVQTTVGDYNAVPLLTPATFTNFSFTGSGAASTLVGAPITVWTVGGFSFQLTSLLSTTVTPGVFSILGTGIASGAGFQDTAGVFSLSGTGNQPSFTFQASTTASGVAVPDGGATVALLGLTLVGLEAMRRKLVLA
jgi:hypothetical protein